MHFKKIIIIALLNIISCYHILSQDINIGIKSITIPDHPRGDYVPFTNCQRDKITKLEFRFENRGDDFSKSGKGLYGSVQIKRMSDGLILLNEEVVNEFRSFTPGWVKFKFNPIDLTQEGLYEITVESYIIDLQAYIKDRSIKPIDSDLSDNKVTYINQVINTESLGKDKAYTFDFEGIQTKLDLAKQGWNFSYLPDSLRISEKGINGSTAIETNLARGINKRKLFTPPVAVTEGVEIDFQFKLIDANSGKNVTEELILSEGFKTIISLQDICSTGVKVTSTYSIPSTIPAGDGFFKFPFILKYNDSGNFRGQIEFSNLSNYPDLLLVIDNVLVQSI